MNASIADVRNMTLPLISAPAPAPPGIASSTPSDDPFNKKIRKPYTITKSRESWTDQEHDKFLEALQLFDRDWKKIEAFVGTKNVIQIRSHAQKYFLKVQKNGTGEHVPPPRPKRKSAQPYPQKASKSDVNPGSSLYKGNCYSSDGSSPLSITQHLLTPCKSDHDSHVRATPDFAEIYTFLGNVFDSTRTGHLDTLKDMAPINRKTILLLMRNLSINLSSTEFEEHKLFSSLYDMGMMQPSAVTGHA